MDIPEIMSALSMKVKHLKVPLNSISKEYKGHNETIFGDINTDYIVESAVDGQVYYVFSIIADQGYDGSEIYNLEVRENESHDPSMKIIVYIPTDKWVESARGDFTVFSGTVNTYSIDGDLETVVSYERGVSTCAPAEPCPDCPTNPHGPGTGAGGGTGTGGGGFPPGQGPGTGGPPLGTGGPVVYPPAGGGTGGGGGCGWVPIMNDDVVVGAYNTCTGQVHYFRNTGTLRVPCSGSGSGVVIDPYTPTMYLADHLTLLGFPLNTIERSFLNNPANSAIASGLRNYLQSHNSIDAAVFVKTSISFLKLNSTNNISYISWRTFEDLFIFGNTVFNRDLLYLLVDNNYVIPNYTVAEYPGLADNLPFNWWNDSNFLANGFSLDVEDPYGQLTAQEKKLVKIFPQAAIVLYLNKDVAFNTTAIAFPNINPHNNKADAFRHAFFNAINVRDVFATGIFSPKVIVTLFANAHESEVPAELILEKQMDVHNNSIGINYCLNCLPLINSNIQIRDGILNILHSGALLHIYPLNHDNTLNSNSILIPTNQP